MNDCIFREGEMAVFIDDTARNRNPDFYPPVGTKVTIKYISQYGATVTVPGNSRSVWIPLSYLAPVTEKEMVSNGRSVSTDKPVPAQAGTAVSGLLPTGAFPDWRKL